MIQNLLIFLVHLPLYAFAKFEAEPALCIGAVDAVLVAAVTLGLPVDPQAKTAIDLALVAAAAVFTRSQVSPANSPAPAVVAPPAA